MLIYTNSRLQTDTRRVSVRVSYFEYKTSCLIVLACSVWCGYIQCQHFDLIKSSNSLFFILNFPFIKQNVQLKKQTFLYFFLAVKVKTKIIRRAVVVMSYLPLINMFNKFLSTYWYLEYTWSQLSSSILIHVYCYQLFSKHVYKTGRLKEVV